MSLEPSESGPDSGRTPSLEAPPTVADSPEVDRSGRSGRVWRVVLAASVAAGVASWFIGEMAREFFAPRLLPVEFIDGTKSMQPSVETQKGADLKNAELAFGIQGGVLAIAMGLAGGIAGRMPRRGLVVGAVASVVGALSGLLAALVLFPILYRHHVPDPNDLLIPTLVQAGIWMAIAAAAGLALAVGLGGDRNRAAAVGGAIVAALLAALLSRLLLGILSSTSGPTTLVAASSPARFLCLVSLSILIAAGATRGALEGLQRPRPAAG